jgi:hypothetical protein
MKIHKFHNNLQSLFILRGAHKLVQTQIITSSSREAFLLLLFSIIVLMKKNLRGNFEKLKFRRLQFAIFVSRSNFMGIFRKI